MNHMEAIREGGEKLQRTSVAIRQERLYSCWNPNYTRTKAEPRIQQQLVNKGTNLVESSYALADLELITLKINQGIRRLMVVFFSQIRCGFVTEGEGIQMNGRSFWPIPTQAPVEQSTMTAITLQTLVGLILTLRAVWWSLNSGSLVYRECCCRHHDVMIKVRLCPSMYFALTPDLSSLQGLSPTSCP